MATGAYVGISGSRTVKVLYIGVANVSKKIKRAYIGVGNVSKLWWVAKLSFSKTVSIPYTGRQNVDAKRCGHYFQDNGSYIVASGGNFAYYVNANDVVGTLSNSSSIYGLVASSGSKVWYMNYYSSDVANGFYSINNSLVTSGLVSSSVAIDYNGNYGGASYSFTDLGIAAFFRFRNPNNGVIRLYENGTTATIADAFDGTSFTSYDGYIKVSNYLIFTTGSDYYWYKKPAVNVANGVIQTFDLNIAYACGKAKEINGTTIVACGSPANSVTKVYAVQSNLTHTELTVPTQFSSLPCISYCCVPYNDKFYFYSGSTSYASFSINLNYLFEAAEDPILTNNSYCSTLGYSVFNGSLYLGLGNYRKLTGLLKGS